jgi:hypothetical protein
VPEGAGARALVAVEERIGRGKGAPGGHLSFVPRNKKVLELSLRLSREVYRLTELLRRHGIEPDEGTTRSA